MENTRRGKIRVVLKYLIWLDPGVPLFGQGKCVNLGFLATKPACLEADCWSYCDTTLQKYSWGYLKCPLSSPLLLSGQG